MNNQELGKEIVSKMGGSKNINNCWHCITRLRFNVNDNEEIDVEGIKALKGVMGAQFQSGQFQIIIGSEVANVYDVVNSLLDENQTNNEPTPSNGNIIEKVFDVISGIFTPILPAIVGGGLLKGVMSLLTSFGWLYDTSSTYKVLNFIADAPFHFLPFLIAFSAAKKFKTDASLSIALAGVLMYPEMMQLADAGKVAGLKFIGVNIPVGSYASSVIPIILGVLLLSYVYKLMTKIVPKSVQIVFVPLLTLLITAPLTLKFIAPLGIIIGSGLEKMFTVLFDVAGPFAGLLMGGLMPLIVITGMHYAFFPGTFASFDKYGYDIMLLPMNLVANLAQAGAVLGVLLKTKNKEMKQLSISTLFPAILGITEPAIYGVTMKLKKPFYASLIGGAVGGGIYGLFNVKTFAFTIPGVMALTTYSNPGTNNLLMAIIGVVASFVTAMVVTLIFKFDEEPTEELEDEYLYDEYEYEEDPEEDVYSIEAKNTPIDVLSPMSGTLVPLENVPDVTFADGLLGRGVAISPSEGIVRAPFSGKVTMTTPSKHAIGLVSDEGVEILIHVGLETVELKGEFFELLVEQGDKIEVNQELIRFDIEKIEGKKMSLISPIVVTNSPRYLDVIHTSESEVVVGETKLLMLIK